jgi:tetratricopeptide (TPR) repeat protein
MFLNERHRLRPFRARRATGHAFLLLALATACFSQTSPPSAPKELPQRIQQSQLEEAERLLKPQVRADPNNPKYLFELGDVYMLMGSPRRAIPFLQKSLQLMPGNWDARMALAQAYQRANNDADALRILGKTPPAGQEAGLWTFTRAFSLYRLGDVNAALPLFKQVLNDKNMRAPANFFVANCYSGMVQYQAALPYYEAAIQFGQSKSNKALNVYYYDYALTLYKLGKYQESRDAFEKSIQRFANDPLPWYYLGRCEARLGSFEKARDSFETAIKKDRSFNPAYYRLARLYAEHGDKKKAHEYYSKVSNELQQQLAESQRLKFGGGSSAQRNRSAGEAEKSRENPCGVQGEPCGEPAQGPP